MRHTHAHTRLPHRTFSCISSYVLVLSFMSLAVKLVLVDGMLTKATKNAQSYFLVPEGAGDAGRAVTPVQASLDQPTPNRPVSA